ncbi:MAG: AAA family ATPase [Spirulina sp. SIO3F2]|nr:AAA family ATPase [Spirulina sp. SIO3F2]
MITEVTLENFKSHRHTHLKFDDSRLHAIVGQNSSGKTSILEAINYASQLFESLSSHKVLIEDSHFQSVVNRKNPRASVSIKGIRPHLKRVNEWGVHYETYFEYGSLNPKKSLLFNWHHSGQTHSFKGLDEQEFQQKSCLIRQVLGIAPKKSFVPSELSKPSYSEDITPKIESNGFGLASVLDSIRDEDYNAYEKIIRMLKVVVPEVKNLSIKRAKVEMNRQRSIQLDDGTKIPYQEQQELMGQEVVLDMKSGDRIPGHALSEGTILTLGLLTVLMSPQRPNLILLDDIQQGLHPKAQLELITVIQEIIKTNPELQIIFTTHSPYILDELKTSQVHVLNTDKNGYTLSKRLDEHPDIEWAGQSLTTGEMWDAEGEEWITADEITETEQMQITERKESITL